MSKPENVLCDMESRTFYLSDGIDNDSIGKICFNILRLNQMDREIDAVEKNYKRPPILIHISSPGGAVYDMWGLIDIISTSETPIYTYCEGYAMSAAFLIFLAGHRRFCFKHTTFMYHQLSTGLAGKYMDLVESREDLDRMNTEMEAYVLERTKFTRKQLNQIRIEKKDRYIYPEEALKLGIVDGIIG